MLADVLMRAIWSAIGQRVIPHSGGGNGVVVCEGLFSVCQGFCSGGEVAPHIWVEVGGLVVAPHVSVGDGSVVASSHSGLSN